MKNKSGAIDTERTDLTVWNIKAEGYHVGQVPAKFGNGKMTFTVGGKFPCLYFLINAE